MKKNCFNALILSKKFETVTLQGMNSKSFESQKLQHAVWIKCLLVLIFCFSSCGLLRKNHDPGKSKPFRSWPKEQPKLQGKRTARISIEKLKKDQERQKSSIELVWNIPEEPVDGFIIRYGISKDNLDKQIKVSASKLERYNDPDLGLVFRYFLKNLSNNKKVFLTLAAYTSDQESKPTTVMEIEPDVKGKE